MAVTRIKAYHGTGSTIGYNSPITNSLDYITNSEKTNAALYKDFFINNDPLLDSNTVNAFDYSVNPEKTTYIEDAYETEEVKRAEYTGSITARQELVSGYLCAPYLAAEQFQATMNLYHTSHEERLYEQTARRIFRAQLNENGEPALDEKGEMIYDENAPVWHDKDGKCRYETYKKLTQPRTAYMWVLSFPPESVCVYKIDPRICHQIGLEFCKQIGGGNYQAVVATHMDKAHPHDHIVMCAYSRDGTHKYRDNLASLTSARQICDDLSRNFGLPVLPTFSKKQEKPASWAEWKSKQEGQSWKEQMKKDIRGAVRIARSYNQFLDIMKGSGYGIRETENHLTYIMPGEEEYRCRDKRLGSEFEKTALIERFNEKQKNKELERDITREAITRIIEDPTDVKNHKPIHILVPRYSFSGRRRSDLEMVFLAAIMIIRELKDRFHDATAAKAFCGKERDKGSRT